MQIRHIVKKPSDNGTFEIGDHITFNDDGSITCIEACGWIGASEVASASVGMESETDSDWLEKRMDYLISELKLIDT